MFEQFDLVVTGEEPLCADPVLSPDGLRAGVRLLGQPSRVQREHPDVRARLRRQVNEHHILVAETGRYRDPRVIARDPVPDDGPFVGQIHPLPVPFHLLGRKAH